MFSLLIHVVSLLICGIDVRPLLSIHNLSINFDLTSFDFTTSILHVISSFIISLAILHVIRFLHEFITSYSSLSKTSGVPPDNGDVGKLYSLRLLYSFNLIWCFMKSVEWPIRVSC